MTFFSPSRKIGWSSAMRILISVLFISRRLVSYDRFNSRALSRRGAYRQRAINQSHTLSDSRKTETGLARAGSVRRCHVLGVEALAIVADCETDARGFAFQRDSRFSGL